MTPLPRHLTTTLALVVACATPEPGPGSLPQPLEGALALDDEHVLAPGDYLRAPQGEGGLAGALRLEGLVGETIDLTGIHLRGAPVGADPDACAGWGVVMVDCEDVTLRGARLGGYRACVVLEGCSGVTLEDLSFEGWYAQRLRSTLTAPRAADKLDPLGNDAGQWILNHGAAISATDCKDLTIRRCRGRHGQNGILLTRVTGSEVYDNDFSFMSGWGLAMYRASKNIVSHNWFDYCVRGYSHGVYSHLQYSAGILMVERCTDNVVAFNSATHGGGGVSVGAGLDLVQGRAFTRVEREPVGCDRNLFHGNDLRFSAAIAIEVTFSDRNQIVANDMSGSFDTGVFAGYSSNTVVLGNTIDDTGIGAVTLEHGQDNVITLNVIRRNSKGVEVSWGPDPHLVQGAFGQQHDTSSRDTWVLRNLFEDNTQDLVVKETTGLVLFDNVWDHDDARMPYMDGLEAEGEEAGEQTLRGWMADRTGSLPTGHFSNTSLRAWEGRDPPLLEEFGRPPAPQVPGTLTVRAEDRGVEIGGRSTIVMGEWGPWDHRSDDPEPRPHLPGGVLVEAIWDAAWFRWDVQTRDPRKDVGVWRALADQPLVHKRVSNFLSPWSDEDVRATVGNDHFGLIARTSIEVVGGTFDLVVTSDDGVRVLVDGEEAFADWTWHAPTRGEVRLELTEGVHELTLEYFQIDGGTALVIELLPAE